MWKVEYDSRLEEWLEALQPEMKARILRIVEMMVEYAPHNIKEPYVKPVKGQKKLFEIRAKGKDGIARLFYFTCTGQKIILLHGFIKKSGKTPARERATALQRKKEVLKWLS